MKSFAYYRRLIRLFYHYKKKSTRLPYFPVRLWIELTSHCNYRCVMCPNKDLKKSESGTMDMDLFQKVLDESEDLVFDINLAHRGESLLHPRLSEAIQYAKKKNFYTRLHTNGSLLTEELSRKIVQSGLDRLSFSFDGYDKDTYEQIRRGGNFEKTMSNIVRFLEIKKESGSKTPMTSIEVINFENRDQEKPTEAKKAFEARFRGLPLNAMTSKQLHNWAGETESKKSSDCYSVCPFPWNALVILWDGKVLPCTQDFFGYYVLGDAKTTSLQEIWNGEGISRLRKKLAEARIDDIETCAQCDRPGRRGFLGVPREYLWKFVTKRMP